MKDDILVKVFRYDPSRDERPRSQEYTVPRQEGMVVGDVLEYIYEHYDGTLAFRYECRTRQCGSCILEVNGEPELACKALVGDRKELVLEPAGSLPVVRDLVTDRMHMLEKVYSVGKFQKAKGR